MLKNYLIVALRNLAKQKLFTSINIFGLAIGLAVSLMALGYITYECSFEDFQKNKDRIYRVNGWNKTDPENIIYSARIMSPIGPAIAEEIPEIESVAIFRVLGEVDLEIGEEKFTSANNLEWHGYQHNGNVICANSGYLDVFTFPLAIGNPETVLEEPFSLLITEEAVDEYFFGRNPIGEIVKINDQLECRITGILKNIPENTQMHCDFIVSYPSLEKTGENLTDWENINGDYVYVLLKEDVDRENIAQNIGAILNGRLGAEKGSNYSFELEPLDDLYFYKFGSSLRGTLTPIGEVSMIIMFSLIAGFILVLAVANFVNLATARSADRIKEVGVRKVFGAYRGHLIKQFLGESIIITFISVLLGLVGYELFKMWIQPMLVRESLADFYNNPLMFMSLIALIIGVGVASGFYPALYLSRFKPIAVLQGKANIKSTKSILRKVLVVFQFTIAIGFICSTVIQYRQINFITGIDLGFNAENIMILEFDGEKAAENCSIMKNEIMSNNRVLSITASNTPPGLRSHYLHGFYTDENRVEDSMIVAKGFYVDNDFISTFELEIIEGRGFSEDSEEDKYSLLINESAKKELGVENLVGHKLYGENSTFEIVGVLKDFQGSSLDYFYQPISILMLKSDRMNTLCVKLPSDDIAGSISAINKTWNSALPEVPYEYKFLDDEITKSHEETRSVANYFAIFSILAVSIACFGIFGLVSFAAEQRTKEIGIRKVLGASIVNIIRMLSKEFIILIVIANIIAWPITYWLMESFMEEFPFRVDIGIGTFILTGLIALLLAMLSAGYQAFKAARANPINAIQHE